jgi:L,D-transpeptidase YcbB
MAQIILWLRNPSGLEGLSYRGSTVNSCIRFNCRASNWHGAGRNITRRAGAVVSRAQEGYDALGKGPNQKLWMGQRMRKSAAVVFLAMGLGFAALLNGYFSSSSAAAGGETDAPRITSALQSLSAGGEQELRTLLESGRLADLQWPNFSDKSEYVKQFYEESGNKLGWIQGGKPTPQALELIGILEEADEKGLDNKDYDGARWPGRVQALQGAGGAAESALVRFDVALTVSAIRYVSDLHLGKMDPKVLHKDFDPEHHKHDPGAFLWQNVVGAISVKEALAPVEPPFPGYKRTLVALQKYLPLAKAEVPDPLPQVQKPVAPGQNYEGVAKLVQRLQLYGDLPASMPVPAGSQTYTPEMAEGVKSYQTRHDLDANGKLGPETISQLNTPLSQRVEQLRLMLERWRWLPHNFTEPPIVVNIPEFALRAYDDQLKPAFNMRVVVGRAMRGQTPVLAEEMKYLIFWPYWVVPPSILHHEIVPKIEKDPGYLQKENLEVVTYSGQLVTDGVVSKDVLAQLHAGKLMVRQKPGPKNALGLIKFIFPNNENVYLHSTPAQSLFSKERRDFSHGCIRVEDPKKLAEWVLRNNPGWTRQRIEAAFAAQKQEQVNLTHPIPVLLVYGTAIVKDNGQIFFFDDIYGFDKAMEPLFSKAYASRN